MKKLLISLLFLLGCSQNKNDVRDSIKLHLSCLSQDYGSVAATHESVDIAAFYGHSTDENERDCNLFIQNKSGYYCRVISNQNNLCVAK